MGIFVDENGPTRLLKILSDNELLWDNRTKSRSKRKSKSDAKPLPKAIIALLEYFSCKSRVKTKRHKMKHKDRSKQPSPALSVPIDDMTANSGIDED